MTTEFLDKQFIREFRDTIRNLKTNTILDLTSLSLPAGNYIVDTSPMVHLQDIEEDHYSKLNNSIASILPNTTVNRHTYWNSGAVMGEETYHAPTDSVILRSSVNIALPAGYKPKNKHFDYVDYRLDESTGQVFYYYALPKEVCYPVITTSLVLSERRKPAHYGGVRVLTTTGHYFYLYVVKSKGLKNVASQRIIMTALDPTDLVQTQIPLLLDWWISTGEIFDYHDLEVSLAIDNQGNDNLAYSEYEPTEDYTERPDINLAELQHNRGALL